MDWVILDVVIGLSFLFFLLSIIAAAMNEAIAGIFRLRARMLEQGIINLINGTPKPQDDADMEIVRQLYAHSLVNGYSRGTSKPSYLASRSFRNALFDVTDLLEATSESSEDPLEVAAIKARVDETLSAIPNAKLRETLTAIWRSCHHDATEFRAGVERWFDRGMERVSGWYKRRTQLILFVLGIGVAIALNASALTVADELWRNDGVRDALVAQVENQGQEASATEALDELKGLQFPVGLVRAPPAAGRRRVARRPRRLVAHRVRRHVRRAVLVRRARPLRQPARRPAGSQPTSCRRRRRRQIARRAAADRCGVGRESLVVGEGDDRR